MPLMRCPDCHKEISESAISCPNCGLPRPQYELMNRERQAAESLAADDRKKTIQLILFFAGAAALISTGIIIKTVLDPWTSATLGMKGKNLLGAALGWGVAYGLYQYSRHLKGQPL